MLLPTLVFSQETLVRWKTNQSAAATSYNTNVSAGNITATGINITFDQWNHIQTSNWPAQSNIDPLKYVQFSIAPIGNNQLSLDKFNFKGGLLYGDGGPRRITIRYSLNSDFSNPVTILDNDIPTTNQEDESISFGNVVVPTGQTLYVRFYGYQRGNPGWSGGIYAFSHINGSGNYSSQYGEGPAITGTVSPAGGVTAVPDNATVTENGSVNINVLNNDLATNTTISSVAVTSQSANGNAVVQPNNTITFTPTTGYFGTTSFDYQITGEDNSTDTATATITVNPFVAPTANNDAVTTGQNIPVTANVLNNDIAGDGTINAVTVTGAPSNGTAVVNPNKTITYTPNSSFTGTEVITYTATDSNNKSDTATLTITVQAVVAAVANNDAASTAKNTPITLNVLSNDTPGNSAITTVAVTSASQHGTTVVNADKSVTYTPANEYTGNDTFTYTVTDAYNTTDTAVVTINVLQPALTGALCGTYNVGSGGDFETITEAVAHINSNGVECPVTFLLTDTNYNNSTGETFPLTINQFTGTSQTNTVTFKPAPGVNTTIQTNDGVSNYQATAVFKFNGADNVIFDGSNSVNGTTRNLTLFNNNSIGYVQRTVFWVGSNGANGANRITVKNTIVKQGFKNADGNFCVGIYSGSNSETGDNNNHTMIISPANANNSNLTIQNNDFVNVKQGIYINGGSTLTTNVTIHQNDLGAENNTETIIQPAYLSNVNGFSYTENLVYNLYRDTNAGALRSAGIHIAGNTSNGQIRRNNMRDLVRTTTDSNPFAGITLESTNANSNITIANNFILNVSAQGDGAGANNGHGIFIASGGGYKIYHNTVKLQTNQPSTGRNYSACLYIQPNVTTLDVRNNIFTNNQTNNATERFAIVTISPTASTFSNLNYNDYFSAKFIGNFGPNITDGGNPYAQATLSGWQTASGKDANSINVNPIFASATDLHIDQYNEQNASLSNLGTGAINAVIPNDIDGQMRNTATPDMGADEFGAIQLPEPGTDEGIYCDSSTTWDGEAWSNGEPTSDKDVIFAADYTQNGGTLNACSIFVEGEAEINFINDATAVIVHSVNVGEDAFMTFESSSNLIQIENTQNTGIVTVKRNGSKLRRLDYAIWSSPVSGTQTLLDFSPNTVANRFYEYNTAENNYLSIDPEATTFAKGKGYLIRMPNSYPGSGATAGYNNGNARISFEGVFEGTPNTGTIRIPLSYTSTELSYNGVGNPYPSPLSVTKFIDANIDNIDGTLYVWRKTNNPNNSSYSTITKFGYSANSAPGGGGNNGENNGNGGNDLIANPFSIHPEGVLNTGQGFIVQAKNTQDLVFRNNMRVDVNYNNFFRMASPGGETMQAQTVSEPSRYWLNVSNNAEAEADEAFAQTMVGYIAGATTGYDNGYDGKSLLDGTIQLYSVVSQPQDTLRLAIQARPEFTVTDAVMLGFTTQTAGTFKISIDSEDGIFAEGQNIYIVDNINGTTHNLKESNYTFTSETGTFEDRFEVIYTTEALNNDDFEIPSSQVIVYRNDDRVNVSAPRTIKSVTIYDTLGRIVYNNANVNSFEFESSALTSKNQVLIIKTTLDNSQVVTKKIMLN